MLNGIYTLVFEEHRDSCMQDLRYRPRQQSIEIARRVALLACQRTASVAHPPRLIAAESGPNNRSHMLYGYLRRYTGTRICNVQPQLFIRIRMIHNNTQVVANGMMPVTHSEIMQS
jgi:hypothetical protein